MTEIEQAAKQFGASLKEMCNAFNKLWQSIKVYYMALYNTKDNRIKHLALYSKKKRTRKKNFNRLLKAVQGDK